MLAFELTPSVFASIKDTIRIVVPDAGSARRVEAAARGLGFNTHAALRAALSKGPATVTADSKAFASFLSEAAGMPGESFLAACAVQAMLATIERFPHVPSGDLRKVLGDDARSWTQPDAQTAAFGFLCTLPRLRDPAFLRRLGRQATAERIAVAMRNAPLRFHDIPVAAAAALHAGLEPSADQSGHGTTAFHVPRPAPGAGRNPSDRHREFGFAFECHTEPMGRHTLYGHGTPGEASRYADLMRASPHGTCIAHSTLSKEDWERVRKDVRLTVFDLCSEIAHMEGRPYPGRPWSEERAKVRDAYAVNRFVRPGAVTAHG